MKLSKKWRDRSCPRCGVSSYMHYTRKICCACRIAERESPEGVQKEIAWRKFSAAVKSGEITRQPCVACLATGAEQRGISQGHHEDYSKPIDVIWLCRSHHRLTHQHGLEGVMRPRQRAAA
jgi:hypothetical protein